MKCPKCEDNGSFFVSHIDETGEEDGWAETCTCPAGQSLVTYTGDLEAYKKNEAAFFESLGIRLDFAEMEDRWEERKHARNI